MRNIKLLLAAIFSGVFVLWLLAMPFPEEWGVYPLRNVLLQLTGVISILAMSGCLILAVRPRMLETPLGASHYTQLPIPHGLHDGDRDSDIT